MDFHMNIHAFQWISIPTLDIHADICALLSIYEDLDMDIRS